MVSKYLTSPAGMPFQQQHAVPLPPPLKTFPIATIVLHPIGSYLTRISKRNAVSATTCSPPPPTTQDVPYCYYCPPPNWKLFNKDLQTNYKAET
uniref:Uncharacterized protein n=1 Tax=Timema bartmani TaxID=61472 RepID=A0A7R9EXU8_9NEOP|nr:unnamed protein product [Timema bartmani]